MAAALKAAEILVPCLFISFHLDVTYITSKHCAFQALCMCNVCSVYILKTIMDAHDTNQENYLLLLFFTLSAQVFVEICCHLDLVCSSRFVVGTDCCYAQALLR